MPVTVNKEACLGCGACEGQCPAEAIKLGADGLAEVDADACAECGSCVEVCPAEAISME